MRTSMLCLASAFLAATAASADPTRVNYGVAAPSGSVFTTELHAGDADDYVVDGFQGMQLTASVRTSRRSSLVPVLTVMRPDGSSVDADDGLVVSGGTRAKKARLTLAANGPWKVRVTELNGNPGPYSIALSTTQPKPRTTTLVTADSEGRYSVTLGAAGGAVVGWTVGPRSSSIWLSFDSLVDPLGRPVPGAPTSTKVRKFRIPDGLPVGDYLLTFNAFDGWQGQASIQTTVAPRRDKARRARLSPIEPGLALGGISPLAGGPGVEVSVLAGGLVDPFAPKARVGLFLGAFAFSDVTLSTDGTTATGTIPEGIPFGRYDVVVTSTSGQAVFVPDAFQIVPRPTLTSIDPVLGTTLGGFELTLTGRDFRAGEMALLINGQQQGVVPTYVDATTIRMPAPPHDEGLVTIAVRDVGAQQDSNGVAFQFVSTPFVSRMNPPLVALIDGETVTLEGFNFSADDRVFVETTTAGQFENVNAGQSSFVDAFTHRFPAPARPKGQYRVYVEDAAGRPVVKQLRTLTYFSYADATAQSGLAVGADNLDAWSSALADYDGDGDLDLFLSRRGGASAAATSLTRVLRNSAGVFTDVTAAVMPAVSATEDWRADCVRLADLDRAQDGRLDLVLVTDDTAVLPANASHVRVLVNEAKGGAGADAADRVFRDRTTDLFAPVRMSNPFTGSPAVADNWRGLDLWIGDLDANTGPPELLITHKETKEELDVRCVPYCASPAAGGYTYGFYWGGSRALVWDRTKAGGLGRYKFHRDFFPRKGGMRIPFVLPGGGVLPFCNESYGYACRDRFTPFTGKRIAVLDLDLDANGASLDGRPDVAVLSDDVVQRKYAPSNDLTTISSLQVALQRFNPPDGAYVTDVTHELTALGGDFRGDALAVGRLGYPDGDRHGVLALTKASAGADSVLRIVRFKPATLAGHFAAFDDISTAVLPSLPAVDRWQATRLAFRDIEVDGDEDLVLLAEAAPGGVAPALRILRNEESGGTKGLLRTSLDPVLPAVSAGEHFEGATLAIGDVTGDGFLDYVVSRAVTSGSGPQTRVVKTDH